MQNKSSLRARAVPSLIAKRAEQRDDSYDSADELPCDSPISEISGLKHVKLSKYYPRHSVLFAEGQQSRGVYVLCEGRATVSIASAEGKTVVLTIAQPGEMLGINATLTGEPYNATVETLERCRIDFVPREALFKLLDRDGKACLDGQSSWPQIEWCRRSHQASLLVSLCLGKTGAALG